MIRRVIPRLGVQLQQLQAGIYECMEKFGVCIVNSSGRQVPVRQIGEQHVMEDCGRIPTVADWFGCIHPEPWMKKVAMKSKELEEANA